MSMTELNIDRLAESYYAEHDPEFYDGRHVDYFTGLMGDEEDMAPHHVNGQDVWIDKKVWRHRLIAAERKLNAFVDSLDEEEKQVLIDEMGGNDMEDILR